MDAAYILLNRLWLCELNLKSFEKSNTYIFLFNRKKSSVNPFPPKINIGIKRIDY